MTMNSYLIEIDYTIDGTPRTQRPRAIQAADTTTAKTIALGNFARGRDGKRVKVQGTRIV